MNTTLKEGWIFDSGEEIMVLENMFNLQGATRKL